MTDCGLQVSGVRNSISDLKKSNKQWKKLIKAFENLGI
jgi:hypothetical protein